MRRRDFIALAASAATTLPFSVIAQQPQSLHVGYSGMLPRRSPHYNAFEQRMAELGYVEGRNFTFDFIQSPGIEGYEQSFRELASRGVNVMIAGGNEPALRAARAAAGATPVVFFAMDFDPVEKGYVASLSRPGHNTTGIFVSQLELAGKRVEILRDAFPHARRLGLLFDPASRDQAEAALPIAQQLGFEPRLLEIVGERPDYAVALSPIGDSPGEPVMIPASPIFLRDRANLVRLLIERRAPSICAFREVMEAGALMSYGVNLVDVFRDVAGFVDQIAKGANAGETPMRELSHFHIAVNLNTAKALGLDISPMLIARADEVIE
jgi:putative ABC transport system substrate-binding protein